MSAMLELGDVADELFISCHTVVRHVCKILLKTGASNRGRIRPRQRPAVATQFSTWIGPFQARNSNRLLSARRVPFFDLAIALDVVPRIRVDCGSCRRRAVRDG